MKVSHQYTYDSMGNILTLKRNGLQDGGTYGLVDNLTYTYNGNQLIKISITSITYNVINQPQKITFSDGKTTEYVYSYDGTKLQTVHKTLQPQTSATTTYCGNLIYENGALKQMLVDGGYVTFSGATPVYHFYIQDHLGNNRVVAKADGTVKQINHYYPYGGLMADICTGSDIQPYKYNGKELDRMHGLDTYDYGARQHNAATGRWDRMDQKCEKYYDVSPYVYCGDNPIIRYDVDGMDWYQDTDKTWQYSPDVHSQKDLEEGQIYKGRSFSTGKGTNLVLYRSDGSILYNNETAAYNRIWNQADVHYRQMGEKGGREVGGFILSNGKVLVLPDYKNNRSTSDISGYGYQLNKNGTMTKGKETFNVLANIHTHQDKSGDATPSYYPLSTTDLGVSKNMGNRPVLTMGHDNIVYGILYNKQGKQENFSLKGLKSLLRREYTIYPWLKKTKF